MLQNNPLLAQLKQQMREALPTKEGIVRATTKSFGFLDVGDKESIFITPPNMKKVLHGDRITAVISQVDDKFQAEPQHLHETAVSTFVGRIRRQKNKLWVQPEHPLMRDALKAQPVAELSDASLQEGDWVIASLTKHALVEGAFLASITTLIAKNADPEAPWWVVLARNHLPKTAPEMTESLAILHEEPRTDLTALAFFTIDGESTQDMDDAIQISETPDGWRLRVAVADPGAYIPPGSELDKEAATRAYTTYLPGRNIPMLPRQLADEWCSLHPGQQRPAICATLHITRDGRLQDESEFCVAWVCSKQRFSYNQISDYLEQKGDWQPDALMSEQLQLLAALAHARLQWRQQNAVVFQDKPDYRFELADNGDVVAVHAEHRRIANQMVEEAMIAANVACGAFLANTLGTGLFNTHSGFDTSKLAPLQELLNNNACPVAAEHLSELDGYCALRRWLQQQPTPYLDNRCRRYQSYATVSLTAAPHFGMGLTQYATWTSPIRKYGDLLNQRLIKAALAKSPPPVLTDRLTQHLAEQRKVQRKAERDIADWLYCQFFAKTITEGNSYTGEIQDINRAGMRLRLLENGAQGFLPLSALSSDSETPLQASWEEGRCYQNEVVIYELGQQLSVQLHSIDEDNRSITLKLLPVATPAN